MADTKTAQDQYAGAMDALSGLDSRYTYRIETGVVIVRDSFTGREVSGVYGANTDFSADSVNELVDQLKSQDENAGEGSGAATLPGYQTTESKERLRQHNEVTSAYPLSAANDEPEREGTASNTDKDPTQNPDEEDTAEDQSALRGLEAKRAKEAKQAEAKQAKADAKQAKQAKEMGDKQPSGAELQPGTDASQTGQPEAASSDARNSGGDEKNPGA